MCTCSKPSIGDSGGPTRKASSSRLTNHIGEKPYTTQMVLSIIMCSRPRDGVALVILGDNVLHITSHDWTRTEYGRNIAARLGLRITVCIFESEQ